MRRAASADVVSAVQNAAREIMTTTGASYEEALILLKGEAKKQLRDSRTLPPPDTTWHGHPHFHQGTWARIAPGVNTYERYCVICGAHQSYEVNE